MNGLFIVFDGLDGSGKGTAVLSAKQILLKKFPANKIFQTAEPTNGFYGKKVRELLKSNVDPNVLASQFLDLYVADRKEHIEKEIIPSLNEGKIILCDRYKYSTFVYQALQGIKLEKIREMHEGMTVPDLVFILDVSASVAIERIKKDSKRTHLESFEKKDFLEKVRKGFLGIKKIFPEENIVFIDASNSVQSTGQNIGKILLEKIATAGN